MADSIPKIIHYCWLSGDPFPSKIRKCIDSWKKYLPDYEIRLWDTQSFDLESSPWVKEAFQQKKYAFAADYIRLYALYNEGGIYLDSDVEVVKSFDDLLKLPYFACTEGENIIEAGAFGAVKGQSWIKNCLDYYEGRHFIKQDNILDTWPLPQIMMKEIKKQYTPEVLERQLYFEKISNYQKEKRFYMLPKVYFCAKDMGTGVITKTNETYCIHHFEMSWIPKSQTFLPNLKRLLIRIFGVGAVGGIVKVFALKNIKDKLAK
ncbi:glycosyltransferase family 32 protein [Epilithonimonas hungarica]|uniref:Glycosyltransferase sugar-binding region containing DXD motif-containing protein n=1 Tax=Epilithonimonas hungarica TaxID=454006 RepID=A0A1G7GHD2_9FLAO|nr:glycosyltransferase [Epilithonimonas hungarica]SDE87568.1 Glycosyltransferase sugar-binding region containing DXD motif-containing protein [Epilithonimonas hungarica]